MEPSTTSARSDRDLDSPARGGMRECDLSKNRHRLTSRLPHAPAGCRMSRVDFLMASPQPLHSVDRLPVRNSRVMFGHHGVGVPGDPLGGF